MGEDRGYERNRNFQSKRGNQMGKGKARFSQREAKKKTKEGTMPKF